MGWEPCVCISNIFDALPRYPSLLKSSLTVSDWLLNTKLHAIIDPRYGSILATLFKFCKTIWALKKCSAIVHSLYVLRTHMVYIEALL